MSLLYIALAPIGITALYKSFRQINASYKAGNKSKLKADFFFLVLIIIVIIGLVVFIEKTR